MKATTNCTSIGEVLSMMAESGEDSGNASSGSVSPSLSPSDGMSEIHTTPPAKPPSALLSSAENSAPLWTRFHVDAYFDSFDDFWDAYESWCDKHLHTFRTASSEALKEADGSMQDRFRFRYIVLHCIHYGQPRTRGGNSRARQIYLPCGCRASIRVSFCYTKKKLRITTLKDEHTNHEVSEESYAKWKNKANKRRSRGEKTEEEEDEKDEDSEQENMDEEWELKKERKTKAAKRKMEPKSAPVAPAPAAELDPPVKRKRGRPRKHPLPTEDSTKEVATVKKEKSTPPKEPKKRGSKISDDRNSNNLSNLSSEVAVEEASEVAVKDLCKDEENEDKKVQECKVDTAAVMAAFLASEFEKDRSNGEDALELTATSSHKSNEAMEPPPILQAESPQLLNNFKHEPLVQVQPVQSSTYSIQRPPPQPTTIPKHYQLNLVQSPAFSLPTPQQIIPPQIIQPQMILPQVIQQPVVSASRDVSFNALLYAYACMVQQQQDQRMPFTGDQPTTQ